MGHFNHRWAGLERKAQEAPAFLSGALNSEKARGGQEGVGLRSAPVAFEVW